MEIVLIIAIGVVALIAYSAGAKNGEKLMLRKIEQEAHRFMNPESPFARTYGRPGFYFHNLHPDLNSGPLAVTSSAQLLRLIAKEQLGNEATAEELEAKVDRMADAYHLASGWSTEKLAGVKAVSSQLHRNDEA